MYKISDLFPLFNFKDKIQNWNKIFSDLGFDAKKGSSGEEYFGNCILCGAKEGFHFCISNLKFTCHKCHLRGDLFNFLSIREGKMYDIEPTLLLFAQKHRIKPYLDPGKYSDKSGKEIIVMDFVINAETGEWNILYQPLYGDMHKEFMTLSYFLAPVEWPGGIKNRFVLRVRIGG